MAHVLLGEMLRERGLVSDGQLRSALVHQRKWRCRIGEALLQLRILDEETLLQVASEQLRIPAVRIGDLAIPGATLRRIPYKLVMQRHVLPLAIISVRGCDRLVVAFLAPNDLALVDEVAFAAGMRIEPVLAGQTDLERAIARHVGPLRADALEIPPDPTHPMRLVDGRTVRC
jgi:hypothetical protein